MLGFAACPRPVLLRTYRTPRAATGAVRTRAARRSTVEPSMPAGPPEPRQGPTALPYPPNIRYCAQLLLSVTQLTRRGFEHMPIRVVDPSGFRTRPPASRVTQWLGPKPGTASGLRTGPGG